jgi:hypothetical protein
MARSVQQVVILVGGRHQFGRQRRVTHGLDHVLLACFPAEGAGRLGHNGHDVGYRVAERLPDLRQRNGRVFNDVMQNGSDNDRLIAAHSLEDHSHRHRMGNIGDIAGSTVLAFVGAGGKADGPVNEGELRHFRWR